MSQVSRRDAVKMVAGMGIVATGVGVIANRESDSEAATKQKATTSKSEAAPQVAETEAENSKQIDKTLESALRSPSGFMFLEQVTFKKPHPKRNLFFTSAYSKPEGDSTEVELRPGTMRIFRAIADQDGFTRQGGLYWKNHKTTGKIQFKHPGALVLAVCEMDGTVNCYSMMNDLRC